MQFLPFLGLSFSLSFHSAVYSSVPRSVSYLLVLYCLLIVNSSDQQCPFHVQRFKKKTHTTRMATLPHLRTTIPSPSPPHSIPLLHHGSISWVLRTPPFHPKEMLLPGIPSPHSTPPSSFSVATPVPFSASSCLTIATPLNCLMFTTPPHHLFSHFPTTGQVNPSSGCVTSLPWQMGKSTSSAARQQTARATRSPPITSSTPPDPHSPNYLPKIHLPASTVTHILVQRGTDAAFQTNLADGWILDPSNSTMTWTAVPTLSQVGAKRDHFAFNADGQVVFGFGV